MSKSRSALSRLRAAVNNSWPLTLTLAMVASAAALPLILRLYAAWWTFAFGAALGCP